MACKDFRIENNVLLGKEIPLDNEEIYIGDSLLNALKSRPDFIGQVDAQTGEQITFQQMRKDSVKCALWLKEMGFGVGNTIAICTEDPIKAYVPYLASLYIGAVVNPWNEAYVEESIRIFCFIWKNKPDVIFIDNFNIWMFYDIVASFEIMYKIYIKIVTFGEMGSYLSLDSILSSKYNTADIEAFSCVKLIDTGKIAITMFSSNVTNYPGDVQIPYKAFTAPSNQQAPIMVPGDIGLWYGSLGWTHSLFLTVRAILSFVTAIRSPKVYSTKKLYEEIEKYKVTWVFYESNAFNEFVITTGFTWQHDLSSLKKVILGDSTIDHDLHDMLECVLPNVSILHVYSMPETGVIACQRHHGKSGSSGYVGNNVSVMIIDVETRDPVGPNIRGEIWCKSPYTSIDDYSTDETQETAKCNTNLVSCKDFPAPWFYTGDIGYYDEDGDIFVIGKAKQMIKYRGLWISSAEIENQLYYHHAVHKVAVISVPHSSDGQHPRAYVQKCPEKKVTKEELMTFAAENLPDRCQLRGGVRFVKSMLYLPNGKIDKVRIQYLPYE